MHVLPSPVSDKNLFLITLTGAAHVYRQISMCQAKWAYQFVCRFESVWIQYECVCMSAHECVNAPAYVVICGCLCVRVQLVVRDCEVTVLSEQPNPAPCPLWIFLMDCTCSIAFPRDFSAAQRPHFKQLGDFFLGLTTLSALLPLLTTADVHSEQPLTSEFLSSELFFLFFPRACYLSCTIFLAPYGNITPVHVVCVWE